jgi:hypothetical protein
LFGQNYAKFFAETTSSWIVNVNLTLGRLNEKSRDAGASRLFVAEAEQAPPQGQSSSVSV